MASVAQSEGVNADKVSSGGESIATADWWKPKVRNIVVADGGFRKQF